MRCCKSADGVGASTGKRHQDSNRDPVLTGRRPRRYSVVTGCLLPVGYSQKSTQYYGC